MKSDSNNVQSDYARKGTGTIGKQTWRTSITGHRGNDVTVVGGVKVSEGEGLPPGKIDVIKVNNYAETIKGAVLPPIPSDLPFNMRGIT